MVTPEGIALGSICVLDNKVNKLNKDQKEALQCLANQVMLRLEMRKKNMQLIISQKKLRKANQDLKRFAQVVSHDMKTPVANISFLVKAFRLRYESELDVDAFELLDLMGRSASELLLFVDAVLVRSIQVKKTGSQKTDCLSVIKKVIDLIAPPEDIVVKIEGDFPKVHMDKVALQQVFQNLITNAIKYNDKEKGIIIISSQSDGSFHYFNVADNGCGIAKINLKNIFKNKRTFATKDRYGNKGTGTGLARVKSIVESSGGKIIVNSEIEQGSVFQVCIPCYN